MIRKSSEQRVAALEQKLAAAQATARKQRTRRLIQLGVYFEQMAQDWGNLTESDKRAAARSFATQVHNRVNALSQDRQAPRAMPPNPNLTS